MTFRTFILSIALLIGLSSQVEAQKFGHLNSGILMSELIKTTTAEKELDVYLKQLEKEVEQSQAAFDLKAQKFSADYAEGKLAKKVAEEAYLKLQQEQEEIYKKAQENQNKVLAKRDVLMKPLFEKVQKAIDEVGKENGFTYIFDTDQSLFNALLFAEDSSDISALVKAKLGLK